MKFSQNLLNKQIASITWLCIFIFTVNYVNAQSITLTFTAQDANSHFVRLNRVAITNLTKNWQETIYWPDTVLTMQNGTSIDEHQATNDKFALSQNTPNPFSSITEVNLSVAKEGEVAMDIADVNGRIVGSYNYLSLPGTHQFHITLATAGTYVMTARQNGQVSSIKMVCNKGGGLNSIDYLGAAQKYTVVLKSTTVKPFNFGDIMEYAGFATINGTESESQRITQIQSNSQTFTLQFEATQHQLPTVTTTAANDITVTSATCGGNVTSNGGANVTIRGVCWSTSQNPTVNGSHTNDGSGIGSFTSNITGLAANTTYYVRAYATNSIGTSYGNEVMFTTLSETEQNTQPCPGVDTITDFDGNIYNTVLIGNQCWMKENLRTTHYANGVSIAMGNTNSNTTAYYTVSSNGYNYNWPAVMYEMNYSSNSNPSGVQGICPSGWHVPSNAEWTQLINYTSSQSQYICGNDTNYIAKALAATTGWYYNSNTCVIGNNPSENNATGFSVYPADGYFTYLWSATEYNDNYALYCGFNYNCAYVPRSHRNKYLFCSVRCLRDNVSPSIIQTPTVITDTVVNITYNSATCGGIVIADGGATITARGLCWSTSQNPTISDSHTTNGNNFGSFTSNITGLTDNTTYYVRAYATNSAGTGYGDQKTFTTDISFLPTISTNNVNNITAYSASCGGNITSDGGTTITARGVCWSTTQNPTIANNHTTNGSGTGSFTSNITGLTPGRTYYVRAYATNSVGTSYGDQKVFTTIYIPTVSLGNLTHVTSISAHYGGGISEQGEGGITSYGICWSTSPNPTVSDCHTIYNGSCHQFYGDITGLVSNTTYYVRAFATNSVGTAYSSTKSFTTTNHNDGLACIGATTLIDYDSNTYQTVQIGHQCWMKQNLRTMHYADGTFISSSNDTSSLIAIRYAPNNNTSLVESFGYLYNWKAVMGNSSSDSVNNSNMIQGICPTGWHVPSIEEWRQLENYLCYKDQYLCNWYDIYCYNFIAKSLAAPWGWSNGADTCSVGNYPSDNNATGFSALPAGSYGFDRIDFSYRYSAIFWSTTEYDDNRFHCFQLFKDNQAVGGMAIPNKYNGLSVRCLRNEGDTSAAQLPVVTTSIITNITYNSATCGGNVVSDGNATVTARGVCWSTSPNPTIANNHTTNGSGIGNFTSNITGLSAGTIYYIRAYATNGVGTVYGDEFSFITFNQPCPNATTLTDFDGNTYNTVKIGYQCWMKENLRTTHYANGEAIPMGSSTSSTTAYRYYPNNNYSNVNTHGYLYNWPAVMHGSSSSTSNPSGRQGICPNGWHVPSDAEWTQLTNYLNSQILYTCDSNNTYIAKSIASTTGWSISTNTCAVGNNPSDNNATGLSILPAGLYSPNSLSFGNSAILWSATQAHELLAYTLLLGYDSRVVYKSAKNKDFGYSVRCLRN